MFWLMPLVSGLGTWAATGDFKKGLMSALLGAGVGGIAGAMGNAASGAANMATSAGTEMATKAAQSGIGAVGAQAAQEAAHGLASAVPGGIAAAGKAAIPAAVEQGGNQIANAGLQFLRDKPVTSGLLLSSLTSAAMAPGMETPENKKGTPFADQYETTDRNTLPFTGGPSPGPSTYTRQDGFTPDNPYRYGQYEGEKMFFDSPGLKRGDNGGIPDLPEGEGGGSDEGSGILGIINRRLREKRGYASGGLLNGPGDGQSDNIEATGPSGRVLLSEGEFVIPADVVAALGAGSTKAGANRLYSAMDKIRTQSYGSTKQAKRPGRIAL